MTSISLYEPFESAGKVLSVPENTSAMSTLDAALAWAKEGFFVLPISPATKHAGSIVGTGWPEKTSRDPHQITAWFAGSNHGLAIHVGRSGAVAFDVDRPNSLPYTLREWLTADLTPFQSTRVGEADRGHYLFATLPGKTYGNSGGRLGQAWGEVRGRNGIIVVAPTPHAQSRAGGRYRWIRTGPLPLLPEDLDRCLPARPEHSATAIDLPDVQAFLDQHRRSLQPELMACRMATVRKWVAQGKSRHDSVRDGLTWLLTEAMAGLHPAQHAVDALLAFFLSVKPVEEWSSRSEFIDMVRWAVAQVRETPDGVLTAIRVGAETSADPEIQEWLGRM